MATLSLSARLDRTESSTPWGFRMQGGRDYGSPLVITRVTPGSLAAKCGLQVGDTITKIGDSPTDSMIHKEAQQKILACGNSLELALQRGGSGPGLARPTAHVPAPEVTPAAPSYGAGYTAPPAAPPTAYSAPLSQAPNYNTAPKPFTPVGGSVPVAVNKQYNTPIDMYSVNNVMDSLATQTAGVTIGQPGTSKSEHVETPGGLSLHENSTSPSQLGNNLTTLHASSPSEGNTSLSTSHTDTKPWSTPKPNIDNKSLYLGAKPVPFGAKPTDASTGVASTGSSPSVAPLKHDTNTPPKVVAPTGLTPTQRLVKESEKQEQTPRIRGYHQDPTQQSRSFRILKTLVDSEEDLTPQTQLPTEVPPPIPTTASPPLPKEVPPPLPTEAPPPLLNKPASDATPQSPPPPPPVEEGKFAATPSGKYVKAIVNKQYNSPMGLYSATNKQDTFETQATQILATIPGVDAEIPDNTERKKIVIPSASPAFNQNTIIESSERKKITVPTLVKATPATTTPVTTAGSRPATGSPLGYGRSPDMIQESAERKKIVVPRPMFNAKQKLEPKSYADKESEDDRESTDVNDGPKPYIPSATFKLVQDLDKNKSEEALKPFGAASGQTQGRSFTLLQKQLDQPSGPPRAGAPAPYKPAGHSAAKTGWQPTIPTGPRKMKVGRAGEATRMAQTAGRIPICTACGIQIRGPFISALEKTWCPDHFVCANPECRMPLIDEGFVEEAGQLFCVRDYEQYFAPRCHKCGAAIIGEIVNAMKQTYHMNCFLCCQCHQPIGSGSFHTEEGKIYCQKDWAALFQTKCYGCQFPIEPGDRWVEALNQNWHSECFNCSTCQVNLEGQSFFAKGGKPYCKKHAGGPRF